MKLKYLMIICLLILSCSTTKHYKSVRFKFKDEYPITVSGKIPNKWIEDMRFALDNNLFISQYLYIYPDSSMMYIYNNYKDVSFPNYSNIKSIDSEDARLRLQNDYYIAETNKILAEDNIPLLPRSPYNITFSGVDKNGLFWKDIKYGNVSIGYKGVLEVNRQIFDNALTSFEVK